MLKLLPWFAVFTIALVSWPNWHVKAEPLPDRLLVINAFNAGTGFAGAALVDNPALIYWNPAGLARSDLLEMEFTAASSAADVPGSWAFLLLTASPGADKFGLGLVRELKSRLGNEMRTFQAIIPMAQNIGLGNAAVGMSLKFISERFGGGEWHTGLAMDGSLMLATETGFRLGLTGQNLVGSALREFQTRSWLGGSWGGKGYPVLLSAQIEGAKFNRMFTRDWLGTHFRCGLSAALFARWPELMAGYMRESGEGWFTTGMSYGKPKGNSRYSYSVALGSEETDGEAHYFTYSWGFNPSGVKPRRVSPF